MSLLTDSAAQVRFCAKRAAKDLSEVTVVLSGGDLIEAKQLVRFEFVDLVGTIGKQVRALIRRKIMFFPSSRWDYGLIHGHESSQSGGGRVLGVHAVVSFGSSAVC